MRPVILLVFVLIVLVSHASVRGAQISQQDGEWVLSNNVYTLKVSPAAGGRITSWRESATGREYCYWDESGGHAGLLDDKGEFSSKAYEAAVVQSDAYRVRLRLTSPQSANGLQIVKTISVTEHHSTIEVQYEYRNLSAATYKDTVLVRNYLLPGAAPGPGMRYFLPSATGLKTWPYPHPDYESYFKELSGNWFALVDQGISRGVAVVIDSDAFTGFYAFMARHNPTLEYLLDLRLAPQAKQTVTVTFVMTRALTHIDHACPELVAAVTPQVDDGRLRVEVAVEPVAEVYEQAEDPQATFELAWLSGAQRIALPGPAPAMLQAPVWPGQRSVGEAVSSLARNGTFALRTRVRTNTREITSWEQPFDVGEATSTYYRGQAQEKRTTPTMTSTSADRDRGYAIHAGGTTTPYRPLKAIELHLGRDELESFEIGLIPLKALGRTNVHVRGVDGGPSDGIEVRLLQHVDPRYDDAYGLIPFQPFEGQPEQDTRLWMIVDSSRLAAGEHRAELVVSPEQGQEAVIPVTITVWPVQKEPMENAELTVWYLLSDVLNHIGKEGLADLHRYGVSEVKVNWKRDLWDDRVAVTRGEGGGFRVDFSRAEQALKIARDHGMTRIAIMYALTNPAWFKSLGDLSADDLKAAEREVIRQMVDMLLRLGFERVEYFWTDEPPTTVGAKEAKDLAELRAIHPRLRIAMTVNHMSDRMMKELEPVVDSWYMSVFTADPRLRQVRSGKIKTEAADDVRIYYAHARIYRHPYADMRGHGWYSGWLGVSRYGVYNYFKPTVRPDRAVFVTKDRGIISTPAWEGVRDGYEDFAYLRRLQTLCKELRNSQHPEAKAAVKRGGIFMKQAFSKEFIELEETFRFGYQFHTMKTADADTFTRLRPRLMAALADLEAAAQANR